MRPTLALEFSRTGLGYVLCKRTRADGSASPDVTYTKGKWPWKEGLPEGDWEAFSKAYLEEFGEEPLGTFV